MRLGVFGGTFDPVHYGHLLMAELALEQCRLDQLWFVPAAVPPHKQATPISDAQPRIEMLELAIGGHPRMAVSRVEIERGGVSFTVDTLAALHAEQPDRELFLVVGADSVVDLPNWRDPGRIAELATLAVCGRAGFHIDEAALAAISAAGAGERVRCLEVEMPLIELSSREIRRRVAAGLSIRFQTPRAVEKYIETQGLYRDVDASAPLPPHGPCAKRSSEA